MKGENLLKKKFLSKFTAVFLVLISLFTMIPTVSVSAAGQTSITLKQEEHLLYASGWGWDSVKMSADGKMIYCVQPDLPAPPNGTYRTDNGKLTEITSSNSKYTMYQKALYYCYGGDGFKVSNSAFTTDASKHQIKYTGNTPSAFMGNLKYSQYGYEMLEPSGSTLHYLLTHVLLSYIYYGDSTYQNKISGIKIPSWWYEPIKDLYNAVKAAPTPPVSAKLYMLDIGSDYQHVIVMRDSIKLQLQKNSANTELTENNNCYSLAGARYDIYLDSACTDYFGYISTNESGYGKYGAGTNGVDVPLQTYYAKESVAPQGYALDETVYKFTNSGKTTSDGVPIYSITCSDTPQNDPVDILLKKTDKNGIGLAGAEFTIKYYSGFYSSEDELENVTATRTWIFKTDSDGYVAYDINYLISGDELYYTGNNPYPILPLGTVTIQETKEPEGYIIDNTIYIIQIVNNNSTSEVVKTYNAPEIPNDEIEYKGKIELTKSDEETSAVLSGAVYGVYKSNTKDSNGNLLDSNKVDTLTTDSNGKAISVELNNGTYYLQEITAPKGYVIDKTVHTVNVNASSENAVVKINLTDKQIVTEISKTDITGDNELPGAKLTVSDSSNNIIDSWTSTTEAHIIKGLISGETYTLTEEIAPNGYATTSSVTFTVKDDGTVNKVVMKDDTIKYEFTKVDDNGSLVKDVPLQVLDSNKNIIDEWVTDGKTNHQIIGKLIVGETYTLHEVSAPQGYQLAKDVTFTVKDTPELQTIKMIDKIKKGSVTLYKQDSDGKSLAGSEWALYNADGTTVNLTQTGNGSYMVITTNKVTNLATNSSGKLYVYDLPQGDYYFIETKSPSGTTTYGKKLEFTISPESEETLFPTLMVKNDKIVLYNTGGRSNNRIYFTGLTMLAISLAVVVIYTLKTKKEYSK